ALKVANVSCGQFAKPAASHQCGLDQIAEAAGRLGGINEALAFRGAEVPRAGGVDFFEWLDAPPCEIVIHFSLTESAVQSRFQNRERSIRGRLARPPIVLGLDVLL